MIKRVEDHRLSPPNRHVLDLPWYIRGGQIVQREENEQKPKYIQTAIEKPIQGHLKK